MNLYDLKSQSGLKNKGVYLTVNPFLRAY